jgi:hypothetical protein
VTQYAEQWDRLAVQAFGMTVEQFHSTTPLGKFIAANTDKLAKKPAASVAA